jgi:predicted transcriptional regulator
MNTHAEKVDIIQWVAGLNDKSVLQQLKIIKDQATKKADWWDTLSIEERQSIERGLEDSKNGRVTPHSEVRKRYEKWL